MIIGIRPRKNHTVIHEEYEQLLTQRAKPKNHQPPYSKWENYIRLNHPRTPIKVSRYE